MTTPEIATLGGGCFWCLEAIYRYMDGVLSIESGYMGGHVPNPDYQAVCTGTTGHVEVVQVTFEPDVTTYREILEVFFSMHDPTSRDKQGNDVGQQYRSVIFYHDDQQREMAERLIAGLEGKLGSRPVVTEVRPATAFYVAEDYHQDYFRYHGQEPYCALVVAPKLAKFREQFKDKLRRS